MYKGLKHVHHVLGKSKAIFMMDREYDNVKMMMIVVYDYGKDPMMFLTNKPVKQKERGSFEIKSIHREMKI